MPQDWKDLLKDKFGEELATIAPDPQPEAPAPRFRKQRLIVTIDRRRRAGKQVTLVSGFEGDDESCLLKNWRMFCRVCFSSLGYWVHFLELEWH